MLSMPAQSIQRCATILALQCAIFLLAVSASATAASAGESAPKAIGSCKAASSLQAPSPDSLGNPPTFQMRRGINISPGFFWFNKQGTAWIRDPGWTDEESAEDYALIKNAGFDFVRFIIEPTPIYNADGAARDALYRDVESNLQTMLDAGLNVLVDLHPVNPAALAGLTDSADLNAPGWARYRSMVWEIARRLSSRDPARVALELMNEPHGFSCESGVGWNTYQPDLMWAARHAAPQMTLVLTGGCYGGIYGLQRTDPRTMQDANVIWSVHDYTPFEFTHQGATWADDLSQFLDGQIPYPASKRSADDVYAGIARNIDTLPLSEAKKAELVQRGVSEAAFRANLKPQARKLANDYANAGASRATLAANLVGITDWAQKYSIHPTRIFVGEFGALKHEERINPSVNGAPPEDRVEWTRDQRVLFEGAGLRWAAFNYFGNYGLLTNKNLQPGTAREIDQPLLAALGLATNAGALAAGKTYAIANRCSGKLLDVSQMSMLRSAPIWLWEDVGQNNQRWRLIDAGTSTWSLQAVHSGMVLGIANNGTTNGALAAQWPNVNADNQRYRIEPIAGGDFTMTPLHAPTKRLDAQWEAGANATPVQIWDANGSCAQKWTFTER
jgi:endoglucanase